MKNAFTCLLISVAATLAAIAPVLAQTAVINVKTDQPGVEIPPTLWGVFFEDINLSADGGIYPELVRNRSFEDSDKPEFWTFTNRADGKSEATVDSSRPLNPLNKNSLRLRLAGEFTLENKGYYGMGITKGNRYTFRVALRGDEFSGPLKVKLISASGTELAAGEIREFGGRWNYHDVDLTAKDSDAKARLQISGSGTGTLYLDMVSLLPKETWKNHGLRPDLAEAINDLNLKRTNGLRDHCRLLGCG